MLIAPTVKTFFAFSVGAGNPAEIWTFPNVLQRWSVDLFAAGYFTKNVIKKLSSGQNLRKGFFVFFCDLLNSLGFTGVFAEVWEAKKWDGGEEFGEDRGVGT
jgi:hypothetical protein